MTGHQVTAQCTQDRPLKLAWSRLCGVKLPRGVKAAKALERMKGKQKALQEVPMQQGHGDKDKRCSMPACGVGVFFSSPGYFYW